MTKTKIVFLIAFLFSISIFAQSFNEIDDNDQKQGKWVKTHNNGNKRYEGQFRNNKPYGTFTYYYENGQTEAVNTFSDDGIIANAVIYHQNGKKMAEGKYVNQKKQGTWKYFSELDEKLVAEENYTKGLLDGESRTFYAENGGLLEVILYRAGLKSGSYQKYFPGESLMIEGYYENDLLEGEYITYDINGNIQTRGKYSKGLQIGNWEYFDEEGNLLTEEQFKNDAGNSE